MYIRFTNTSDYVVTCFRNASVSSELTCSNQQAKVLRNKFDFWKVLRVSCKVSEGLHVNFAKDPKYS